MNKISTLASLIFALCLLIIHFGHSQNKAIFIILDGIPADVLESVKTPTLDEISKLGGYTRAYTGGERGGTTESPTISAVCYNNILTGVWANKHNVWGNNIENPNYDYWNIFRIVESDNPSLTTAIYSTWLDNRTKLVGDGLAEAGSIKIDYSFDGFENDTLRFPHDLERRYILNIDELVSKEAARNIKETGPDLAWVYLEYTDDMGHKYGDSPELNHAVRLADDQIKRIWEAIKYRENEYGDHYLLIVTTDHGRDAETGRGHGGQTDRERTIWIVTNAFLNESFPQTSHVDILPAILDHMQIDAPTDIKNNLEGSSFLKR